MDAAEAVPSVGDGGGGGGVVSAPSKHWRLAGVGSHGTGGGPWAKLMTWVEAEAGMAGRPRSGVACDGGEEQE